MPVEKSVKADNVLVSLKDVGCPEDTGGRFVFCSVTYDPSPLVIEPVVVVSISNDVSTVLLSVTCDDMFSVLLDSEVVLDIVGSIVGNVTGKWIFDDSVNLSSVLEEPVDSVVVSKRVSVERFSMCVEGLSVFRIGKFDVASISVENKAIFLSVVERGVSTLV